MQFAPALAALPPDDLSHVGVALQQKLEEGGIPKQCLVQKWSPFVLEQRKETALRRRRQVGPGGHLPATPKDRGPHRQPSPDTPNSTAATINDSAPPMSVHDN